MAAGSSACPSCCRFGEASGAMKERRVESEIGEAVRKKRQARQRGGGGHEEKGGGQERGSERTETGHIRRDRGGEIDEER